MDLLPLYHDNIVSEPTKIAIDEHLETCENCKKECELLGEELPEVKENTTKDKFAQMVKKQKLKRIVSIVVAVAIGFGIAFGAWFFLTQVALKPLPGEEIEVFEAFVVETEYGKEVFVWYNSPTYINYSCVGGEIEDGETVKFVITKEVALLAKQEGSGVLDEQITHFSLESSYSDEQYGDIEEIYFNDNLIWSEAENADDQVPAYVYEYLKRGWTSQSLSFDYNMGLISIGFDDEPMTFWDLDGNVIEKGTMELK